MNRRRGRLGVRTRILAIGLAPGVALLIVGGGAAGFFVSQSRHAQQWAEQMRHSLPPAITMIETIQQERLVTMRHLSGDPTATAQLPGVRANLDAALRASMAAAAAWHPVDATVDTNAAKFGELAQRLPGLRARADTREWKTFQAYGFYNELLDIIATGVRRAQDSTPDPEVGVKIAEGMRLLAAAEAMARSNALAAALESDTATGTVPVDELAHQVGYYRIEIAGVGRDGDSDQRAIIDRLTHSASWDRLGTVENVVVARAVLRTASETTAAPTLPPLPSATEEWQQMAEDISRQLTDLWLQQNAGAQRLAEDNARRSWDISLLAGGGVLLVSILAMAVSVLLANRVIGRLHRLRSATLELAEQRLPAIVHRLAADEPPTDPIDEQLRLDFGTDEIGQVAAAFEQAADAAVSAAVVVARTREGVKRVFLNIAHRSQIVVHRQLEILDEAERREEDPATLHTLFQLDHLAARGRRNAENLLILGGGRVGRQWRVPVTLIDVVRSGVGEAVDYTRVRIAKLPQAHISGEVVADIVHLLAELVDNAATFSPPESRVDITGTVVGKGLVVQIADQGVGMTAAQISRANEILSDPPDFGAILSDDTRLGLFVVARLAARHRITVKLAESDYGGIRAIVLIEHRLLAGASPSVDTELPSRRRIAVEEEPRPLHRLDHVTRTPEPPPASGTVDIHQPPTDARPALPRRVRRTDTEDRPEHHPQPRHRAPLTADQARAMYSSIEAGTREHRHAHDDPPV